MRLKTRPPTQHSGVVGTTRTQDRRSAAQGHASLTSRLSHGDIAVLDQVDLDLGTAEALVAAEVVAVLNRAEMSSGRFPNRGPALLAEAGIVLVDRLTTAEGKNAVAAIGDGRRIRVEDGQVWAGERLVATGRALSRDDVDRQLADARAGLVAQLQTLTHNSAEFLRREEDLVLHGRGLPRLRTELAGRPVVLVADGPDDDRELRLLRRYLREVRPTVIAVGRGVETARAAGLRADIVVLDARTDDLPSKAALVAARDVVLCGGTSGSGGSGNPGSSGGTVERLDRMGVRPVTMHTTAALDDAALLVLDAEGARPIITVGVRGSLEEFLDSRRGSIASGYVTRLKTGAHLVDATAVPALYSGQLRARHAYLVLLIGLLAVAAAIAATPVGHQWATDLGHQLHDAFGWLQEQLR